MFKKSLLLVLLSFLHGAIIGQNTDYKATYYVDGNVEKDQYRSHISLESLQPGASTVYATNGVHLVLTRMRLNKTSGSLNDDDRRETGYNSVLLADCGSNLTVEYCEVNSHTTNSDGISACGDSTRIKVIEGTVNVSRSGSAAMNASGKSLITADKTTLNTYATNDPAFYACNDGRIEVHEATGGCSGQASPLFYTSAGTVTADKCRMSSDNWTIASVDKGVIKLSMNELKAGSVCGFLVYCADEKRTEGIGSSLILDRNTIQVSEGPLILVTNSAGHITLSNNKISYKGDEVIAVRADDWGTRGSNYGDAIVVLDKQALAGDIYVDSISRLELYLEKGGKLRGSITGPATPGRRVRVNLKKGGEWTVKGDCHITALSVELPLDKALKSIKGKHIIYYDPKDPVNEYLGGKEYKTGGGVLRPETL